MYLYTLELKLSAYLNKSFFLFNFTVLTIAEHLLEIISFTIGTCKEIPI